MNFATWRLASVAFKQHDLENGGKVFYSIKLTMEMILLKIAIGLKRNILSGYILSEIHFLGC